MPEQINETDKPAISGPVRTRRRSYLSTQHLMAARLFAKLARGVEVRVASGDTPRYIDSIREKYRSFVIGAVFAAVAFLEAQINEFLDGLREGEPVHLDSKVISTAVKFLDRDLERRASLSILEKYDLTLELFDRSPFDRGAAPYQDVRCLIQLRNALVHYKPEWVVAGVTNPPQADQHRLEQSLRGRFEESPLDPPDYPFYPDRCVSAGCADWAYQWSLELVKDFLDRLGVDPSTLPISSSQLDEPAG